MSSNSLLKAADYTVSVNKWVAVGHHLTMFQGTCILVLAWSLIRSMILSKLGLSEFQVSHHLLVLRLFSFIPSHWQFQISISYLFFCLFEIKNTNPSSLVIFCRKECYRETSWGYSGGKMTPKSHTEECVMFLQYSFNINEWMNVCGSVKLHFTNKVEIHPLLQNWLH